MRQKKILNKAVIENKAPLEAGDDVINGNQTTAERDINNITEVYNYYCHDEHGKTQNVLKEQTYQKDPQPAEIVEEVEQTPEPKKEGVKAAYVGKDFEWKLKFNRIKKKGDDKYRVFFFEPR